MLRKHLVVWASEVLVTLRPLGLTGQTTEEKHVNNCITNVIN
jgi:hypothetical protein